MNGEAVATPPPTRRAPWLALQQRLLVPYIAFLILCGLPFVATSVGQVELYHALLVAAVAAGVFVAYVVARRRPQRTLGLYFCCVFVVFHFGLAPVFLLPDDRLDATARFGLEWYWDFVITRKAHLISLVFLAGLLAANLLPAVAASSAARGTASRPTVWVVSIVSLVAAIVGWLALVVATGAGDYADFIRRVEATGVGALFGVVHGCIDAAFLVAIMTGRSYLPFALFLGWGVLAFSFGLRGEVAFPLVVALGLLVSQRRLAVPVVVLLGGSVAFLGLSAFVASYRVSAASDVGLATPLAVSRGLAELGGSLRPVHEVVKWAQSDDLLLGASYAAPFERSLLRMFPVVPRLPGELDERLMNVLIVHRAGPYGFSMAAEAYYNFGLGGVLPVGMLVGWTLIVCGNVLAAGRANPVAIALTVGLFDQVRQSFVNGYGSALSTLAAALAILAVAGLIRPGSRQIAAAKS